MKHDDCANDLDGYMETEYGTFRVTLSGRYLNVFLIGCSNFKYDIRVCAELVVEHRAAYWDVSDELSFIQELDSDSQSDSRVDHPGWAYIAFWHVKGCLPKEFTAEFVAANPEARLTT